MGCAFDGRPLLRLQALMSMYNKLGTVEGYLQDAQSEVYCATIRDRWCVGVGLRNAWLQPADADLAPAVALSVVVQ